MLKLIRNIFAILLIGQCLTSCKEKKVDGIQIGYDLYENQTFSQNKELRQLINQVLSKDEKALAKLCYFECGGGAGCYDLGFVVTQIIYKIGENDFITMTQKLSGKETLALEGLIDAGLEYGDNDKDGKMDDKRIENEFKKLANLINLSRRKE